MTERRHGGRVLGVPVAALAVVLGHGLAHGADLAPAAPPPSYVAPPPVQPVPISSMLPASRFDSAASSRRRWCRKGHPRSQSGAGLSAPAVLPDPMVERVRAPSPVGGMINLDRRTCDLYAGALWNSPPYHTFFELFVDGAIHDGVERNPLPAIRARLPSCFTSRAPSATPSPRSTHVRSTFCGTAM